MCIKLNILFFSTDIPEPVDPQICQATCAIMKLSFEEEFRRAMNELGLFDTKGPVCSFFGAFVFMLDCTYTVKVSVISCNA